MAHAEVSQAVAGETTSGAVRQSALADRLDRWLGYLVEIPVALLVVAEIVILFIGPGSRSGVPSTCA
jgi:hypothetical protein